MDARFTNLAVLLVDDDVQQAVATRDALKDLGCNPVAWATNWEQAERMAASTRPQIFVVDACLHSGDDGINVVKRLRRQYRAPVVFLVEQADTDTVRRALKIRAATSLVRPYDRSALAVALAEGVKLASAAYLAAQADAADVS
jgi:DNA-binding NtrC family response regulator